MLIIFLASYIKNAKTSVRILYIDIHLYRNDIKIKGIYTQGSCRINIQLSTRIQMSILFGAVLFCCFVKTVD